MRSVDSRALVSLLLTAAAALGAAGAAEAQKPYTTWRGYSGSPDSSQYSALTQIDKSNVAQLEVAWSFPTGDRSFIFNPVIIDKTMYVLASGAEQGETDVVALDAQTGKKLWAHKNEGAVGARGMNYWQAADGSGGRLFYLNGGFLTALDAKTGETVASFGTSGRVDLRDALAADGWDVSKVRPLITSNPGRVFEDLIIMSLPAQGAGYSSTPGDVTAWDVRTGKLRWVFHSIPHPGELGYDTWPKDAYKTAGGVHNWSELTVDTANAMAFIQFGTARYDFYGGNRPGNNLFANSVVALDARTGKRVWHQQLVHHDLWDYDLPQAPKLLTIHQNGRAREVVAQATKHGFLFVFDRKTGEPIWPIEERPVPQSTFRASTPLPRSRSRRSRRRSRSSRSPRRTSTRSCRRASRRRSSSGSRPRATTACSRRRRSKARSRYRATTAARTGRARPSIRSTASCT